MTRRHFLGEFGTGVGAAAMGFLMGGAATATAAVGKRADTPKAKRVIYLHMAGSPSQLDLFDYKPILQEYSGKPCPEELLEGKRFAFLKGVPNLLGTPYAFDRHGECGASLSELLPHLSTIVDDITIVKSMVTDQFNHAPAQLLLQTGSSQFGGASMGSWVTYGLGSENSDLPGFIVLVSGGKAPSAGKSLWGSGFLPTVHQGVQCRTHGEPVLYLSDPEGMDRAGRRDTLDTLKTLNEIRLRETHDPETEARIAQYELAFRMQIAAPEIMDISKEPQHILDMYGAVPGYRSNADAGGDPRQGYRGDDASFANNCLLARRLVENGVRFVQLYDWGWDHHGTAPGESIDKTLPIKARQTDRAVAALVKDLKQRGMLDDTLVVWGGEFGRTPMQQKLNKKTDDLGRDHQPDAFTIWIAGGGVKRGLTYGETDELGYRVTENPVHIRDLQATILHLLGLNPWEFNYPYLGLNQRLIGPEGKAKIMSGILV
jgi:hypothetical protein